MPGPCPNWWTSDSPSKHPPDASAYTLSGAFVTQLMTEPSYRARTATLPVVINGAHIAGNVLVRGGKNEHPVTITCSVIDGDLQFLERNLAGSVKIHRVRTSGRVELSDVRVLSSVSLFGSDVGGFRVAGSQIDGSLALRGARVRDATGIFSTIIGRGVRLGCPFGVPDTRLMGCRSRYGLVDVKSVQVGGLLEIGKADFHGRLTLQSVDVDLSLVARGATYHDHFSILDGTFGHRLQMIENVARASVFMEGVRVAGSFSLRDGHYANVAVRGVEVGGDLDFRNSEFHVLDLTGTAADRELRLAGGDDVIRWAPHGPAVRFVLKNARVQSLQDSQTAWPSSIELDGFEYEKLGGLELPSAQVPYLRGADWFREWLARDQTYSPQPYRHLSAVLRREGQTLDANAILYEVKERERLALPIWNLITYQAHPVSQTDSYSCK